MAANPVQRTVLSDRISAPIAITTAALHRRNRTSPCVTSALLCDTKYIHESCCFTHVAGHRRSIRVDVCHVPAPAASRLRLASRDGGGNLRGRVITDCGPSVGAAPPALGCVGGGAHRTRLVGAARWASRALGGDCGGGVRDRRDTGGRGGDQPPAPSLMSCTFCSPSAMVSFIAVGSSRCRNAGSNHSPGSTSSIAASR